MSTHIKSLCGRPGPAAAVRPRAGRPTDTHGARRGRGGAGRSAGVVPVRASGPTHCRREAGGCGADGGAGWHDAGEGAGQRRRRWREPAGATLASAFGSTGGGSGEREGPATHAVGDRADARGAGQVDRSLWDRIAWTAASRRRDRAAGPGFLATRSLPDDEWRVRRPTAERSATRPDGGNEWREPRPSTPASPSRPDTTPSRHQLRSAAQRSDAARPEPMGRRARRGRHVAARCWSTRADGHAPLAAPQARFLV
jgi:hypothetical protein